MKVLIIFFYSFVQATVSTVLSLALALPLAHFFYRYKFPGKNFFISLAVLFCIMPTKLIVLCISSFYGVGGFVAIVLAHLLLNLPFSLYVLNLTYKKLDLTQLWIAQDLGATPWQCYRDVVLPFLKNTLISMAVILFLLHAASFSIPLMLGGKWYHNTPEIMMSNLYNSGASAQAFLYWVLRVIFFVPLILLRTTFEGKKRCVSDIILKHRPVQYKISGHGIGWLLYSFFIVFFTLGPFGALLVRACNAQVFAFLWRIFSCVTDVCLGIPVRVVVLNSMLLAVVSGVCSVLIAFAIGSFSKMVRTNYSAIFVFTIALLPLIFGSVGVGILFAWLSYGKVVSPFLIGAVCHAILNYPFAYRVVVAQLDLYHPDIHKSAQALGATHLKVVRTVTLPFVRSALVRAFCIAFGLSLTEVGAGSVLQSKMGLTMPMAIRMYRKAGMYNELIGLSMVLLVLVLCISYLFAKTVDN